MTTQIKWNLPGPDTPGMFRRQREISKLLQAEYTDTTRDAFVDFLVQYVELPKNKTKAKEAILDLSTREVFTVITQLRGFNVSVPDPKDESSEGQ